MSRILVFVVIGLVFVSLAILGFSGCVENSEISGDPFIADANARATSDAARARIEATKSAIKSAELDQANQVVYMTAVASDLRATETAVAEMFRATATAEIERTAVALSLKSTENAINAAATVAAADLRATETAREFEAASLALRIERERRSNMVRAFFVYAIVAAFAVGTLFAVVYVIVSMASTRIIGRDKYILRGDRLIDPALSHSAVIDISNPGAVDPVNQAKIKERAQIADVVRLLPDRASRSGATDISPIDIERLFGSGANFPSVKIQNVEIIDPEAIRPWVDEVETKLLDDPE